jgi:hypothetical protein
MGGFGESSTPGSVVRTEWKTDDIWLRTTIELSTNAIRNPHLRIHHDEDAEIFINGQEAVTVQGFETDYVELRLDPTLLRDGKNVIAVHCHQSGGGQYIDVGIVDITETPRGAPAVGGGIR